MHGYSSPSPVSASGRLVLLVNADEAPSVVRVEDGGVVYSGLPLPFEGTMWDAVDERFLYFLRDATIVRYNLETREKETVADFSGQFTGSRRARRERCPRTTGSRFMRRGSGRPAPRT